MDRKRVKEIIESHGVIEVLYQNSPVWIEEVKLNNKAEVTVLDTNEKMEVPVEQLEENNIFI